MGELPIMAGQENGARTSPLFHAEKNGLEVVGGNYWFCVFANDPVSFWKTSGTAMLDGYPSNGLAMRKTSGVTFAANSNRFPALQLPTVTTSGRMSIYADVKRVEE